ncbi:iron-containing alcohol dehydrogenase [Candidatus Poribacteria bacterium]|nr:iron-containing alcohol dehydrogenase [Candidatus Poribacteria bacterium]
MVSFDSDLAQRVVFGDNSIEKLGQATITLDGTRVLIITDTGIKKSGILDRAYSALNKENISYYGFTDVDPNPTTEHVYKAVQFAQDNQPIDLIIGLGGGSAMDCAKGVNFILTNGGEMEDYWGTNKATKPMLSSIGIPTTIGTGSEAQSYALIAQENTHIKMACGDKKAKFDTVILDPTLTGTLPKLQATITGIDAIAHAIESFVSTRRNPLSQMYAIHAWNMLESNFQIAIHEAHLDARGKMLFGAYLAGLAIENSMLGAAHACANPLTTQYGITHGIAVSLMLPHVIRFNEQVVGDLYKELYSKGNLVERIESLIECGDLPNTLQQCTVQCNIRSTDLSTLAKEAAVQWTAQFNPRPVDIEDFERLYEKVL